MKSIKDLNGADGIDKIVELMPYIIKIITDDEVYKDKNYLKMGAVIAKNHKEELDNIAVLLGNETAANDANAVFRGAQLMRELDTNKDLADFFIAFAQDANTSTDTTANIADVQ